MRPISAWEQLATPAEPAAEGSSAAPAGGHPAEHETVAPQSACSETATLTMEEAGGLWEYWDDHGRAQVLPWLNHE